MPYSAILQAHPVLSAHLHFFFFPHVQAFLWKALWGINRLYCLPPCMLTNPKWFLICNSGYSCFVQTGNRGSKGDPSVPEVYRAADTQAALSAPGSRDCAGLQDRSAIPECGHRCPSGTKRYTFACEMLGIGFVCPQSFSLMQSSLTHSRGSSDTRIKQS